ncbi:MAG: NAD(P)-binding protein [Solirubrobacterales bacterium]|nr:NAD(P)-binding protein [Solirubrobacterales bacterium]
MYQKRDSRPPRACVIGAGSSGIAACRVLATRGIEVDCFEVGSQVGGNWRYMNDNGLSSAYESLHINTSRRTMAYASFPMPEDYPDYPNHFQIAKYFDDYVDHFGFRDRIRFRTEVTGVRPADGGGWEVSWRGRDDGEAGSDVYGSVFVANGHHWDARWPEPPFPGQAEFEGSQLHVHDYKTPDVLADRSVLVLGIGNSATDIAVESSRNARRTFIAMRRSAWIIPKYLRGKPTDELATPLVSRLPLAVFRAATLRSLKVAGGYPTDFGMRKPDHKLGEAHPTISSELLPRIGHGDITVKPNIAGFAGGRTVRFADGSTEEIDVAIYCTGYKISFPFLDEELISAPDNQIPLYLRVVPPDPRHRGLFFIGLCQPLGAIMPLAEEQSEWIADVLEGKVALPPRDEMEAEIGRDRARMARRYVASKRHTIQVDFHPYMRRLARERGRDLRARLRGLRGRRLRRGVLRSVRSP